MIPAFTHGGWAICDAAYLRESAERGPCQPLTVDRKPPTPNCLNVISSIKPSEAYCWICRVWSMTLAIWKPGYLDTLIESRSATFNRPLICTRELPIALSVADVAPLLTPLPGIASFSHMECQPAFQTLSARSVGVVSPIDIYISLNRSCLSVSPLSNMHPLRRNILSAFTLIAFRGLSPSPGHRRNRAHLASRCAVRFRSLL